MFFNLGVEGNASFKKMGYRDRQTLDNEAARMTDLKNGYRERSMIGRQAKKL